MGAMTYHLSDAQITVLIILAVWELIWKAIALWRAAQRHQPYWFVAILVLNTAGILPILYLLFTEQRKDIQPS